MLDSCTNVVMITQRPDNTPDNRKLSTRQSVFVPYQLAEFIGQLLDHHAKTLKFLEHADQVFTGEATNHLHVFTRTKTQRG